MGASASTEVPQGPVRPRTRCVECLKEKTNRNHVQHVRDLMLRYTGSDLCIRKGCEIQIEHKSGYCLKHYREWRHAEEARYGRLELVADERPARHCARCDEPPAHKKSAYCVKHRREYNRANRLGIKPW